MLNGLGLFEGVSGITLGLERAGLCNPICFVEKEPYAQEVLKLRYPEVPIWDDVTTFDGRPWKGQIDIISGGFPCQDISVAGKKAGITGSRSGLWSEYERVISEIRPLFAFIENVPALFSWFNIEGRTTLPEIDMGSGRGRIGEKISMDIVQEQGIATCIRDLAKIGFNAERCIISAADMGAPHLRKRVFILAYPNRVNGDNGRYGSSSICGERSGQAEIQRCENDMANSESQRTGELSARSRGKGEREADIDGGSQKVAHSWGSRQQGSGKHAGQVYPEKDKDGEADRIKRNSERISPNWDIEPNVGRVADGVPSRVDRLKCLGNAVVPQCAEYIGRLIMDAIRENRDE